jgi:hypothetical protein
MKKLSLMVESLAVESFETGAARDGRRGTVVAHFATRGAPTCNVECCQTCVNCPVTPTVGCP